MMARDGMRVGLLQMSPTLPFQDGPYRRAVNSESLSDCAHADSPTQVSYLPNLVCAQLRAWVFAANARSAPRHSVVRIVFYCPKQEVLWVDARRIVAGMENVESTCFASIGYNPRNSMGPRHVAVNDAERPILVIASGGPFPASVSASDLRPESLEKLGVIGRAQDKLVGTHVGLLGAFVSGAGRSGHAALGPAILPHGGVR